LVLIFRESDIVKKPQHSSFKFSPIATAVAIAITSQFVGNFALAGSGSGSGVTTTNAPVAVKTYYANSPAGPAPVIVNGVPSTRVDGSALPVTAQSGTLLRKFVDTLPGFGSANANNLGQYIPVAVAEKWANPLIIDPATTKPLVTTDDYYEIAAVEFTEKMHSDLPKATRLRGYVQLETAGNALTSKHIALTYPNGAAITDPAKISATNATGQVYAYDNPHHLGPVITATKGTAVRVKFTNYLPTGAGGKLFLPVDTTLLGAGVGPDGLTPYTENRAGMHLVGGQAPWISAGSPHQWVAPAGETAAYAAKIGKGATAQTLPDMTDPGDGSTYLYFPNDLSARFTFIQDRTSGLTRLNAYAGLEAAYVVTDPIEQILVNGGTLPNGTTVAKGTIPAAQIPLIIEDKTFVPANITQQDALWNNPSWGAAGDLWFPHVYEPNQDPHMAAGGNPVGRWDYGPLFWPIFPVTPAKSVLPTVSHVPEAYMDTPVVNGTAYPTLTVEPKAYRMRLLNASNDRYINLGLYKADPTPTPLLDVNGNPTVDASGNTVVFTNPVTGATSLTEVKMVPAGPIDAAGNPPGWDVVNGVQLPLPQFGGTFPWNINAEPSGPTRAWPNDGRAGGAPDPTTSGPDFVVIGNDGGLLPQAVDIPPQPVTYETNRRSITVLNIYGYGLLLGPSERADTIVDFSAYAGQTLILYNDAPAPTPFNDPRNDYYTGNPDLTGQGGAYTTLPGYGPNTRTMMQIVVGSAVTAGTGGPLDAAALAAALPAAYGASQAKPLVPESAYNAAFGTADSDNYGHVATGSAAQPNLVFAPSGAGVLALTTGPMSLITSGGAGTGSGSGYLSAPTVVITPTNGAGSGATGHATINGVGQVASVILDTAGTGYTALPNVTFIPTSTISGIVVADGGTGYTAADQVVFTGGGGSGATASLTVTSGSPILSAPTVLTAGSGYTSNPSVTFTGGGGTGAAAIGLINTSPMAAAVTVNNGGTGYTAATQATVSAPNAAMVPNAMAGQPPVASTQAVVTPTISFGISGTFKVTTPGAAYDQPTTATIPGGGTTVVQFSAPQLTGGALPTATANIDPITGAITGITLVTAGSGYTSAPTVSVTDGFNNTSAVVDPAALAATGSIASVAVTTAGTGYTAPPTITFTTGSGAVTTTALTNPVGTGTLSGLFISNVGSGYTTAPTVKITDANNNSSATATVAIGTSAGTITGITVTNPGKGYTSAPAISFTGAGVGALATANIAAAGVGAQAIVVAGNTAKIPVLTKAEQELFDDYGRYNSTGGVELPLTLVGIQTTVPLSYIDQPTEIIGDGEVQIWKLVDNGLWSNSVHFSMADVQLLNRVGWDGTVKAPASNEVGWKDTVRLNPLEDVLVAVRAKQAAVPFGQPQSTRLQDPTTPAGSLTPPAAPAVAPALGAGQRYASGIGFMVDPGVVTQAGLMASVPKGPVPVGTALLATAVNTNVLAGSTTGNFDNEFTWGSAILGHAENDFTRPVVFNAKVTAPDTSTLADALGTGTLNWTDPTPTSTPATTLANPKNEIGYKLLKAATKYVAAAGAWEVDGAFTPIGTPYLSLPANVTQYIEPVANLAPTTPATGPFFAYQVAGYNVAGSSMSNIAIEAPPNAPAGLGLATAQSIQLPATTTDVQLTATWTDNAVNETNYIVTRTGPSATLPVTGTGTVLPALPPNLNPGSTTTTFVDPTLLTEGSYYKYDVIARNSFGDSKAVLSGTVQAPYYAPNPPTNLAQTTPVAFAPCPIDAITGAAVPTQCRPDAVVLTWTDAAINETRYDVSRNGVLLGSVTGTALGNSGTALSFTDATAAEGVTYNYSVAAVNAAGSNSAALAVTLPTTVPTIPTNVKVVPSTAVDGNGVYVDTATVTWSDNAYNENGYAILRDGLQVGATQPSGAANNPLGTATTGWKSSPILSYTDLELPSGSAHTWQIQALNALAPNLTLGGTTGPSTSAPVNVTMPGILMVSPLNLRAVPNRAGSSIALSWTDNSTNETDFLVEEQLSTNSGLTFGAWSVLGTVPRAGAQTTGIGGLVNFARANVPTAAGNVYNFRVRARNLANKSDSHPYLTVQASLGQPATPAAPTLTSVTQAPAGGAGGLRVGRVTLTWTPVVPLAGTTITYIVLGNGMPITTTALTTFNYRPTLAAELAGITYTVETVQTAIRVVNPTMFGSATSLPSNSITLKAVAPAAPAAPAGLTATVAAATGAVTLNWTAVAPVAGTTITYLVSVNGGAGVPATRGAVFPLATGNSYSLQVAAVATSLGLSTQSVLSTPPITVDLTPAATPNAPATLTVNATTLNWTAPTALAGTGSTNVTYTYVVQKSVDVGATWTTLALAPNTARTLAALSPAGTNYQYRVTAQAKRYGLATSAASLPRTTVFNTAPALNSTPVATQGAAGSRAITVAWTNPSVNITGWTVTRRVGAGVWAAFTPTPALPLTGGSYSFTDTGLTAGTNYAYRVTATSLGGTTAVVTSNTVAAR
jgi:hypothetical protein